jgi:ABC-2 type transport system permease protein
MLGSVLAKTLRDNWRGWAIAVVSLAAIFMLAMSIYRDIDLGIYTSMPEVFRSMAGIPEEADVGSLAVSAFVGTYGAMVVGIMALSMGSAAIAGEERAGTIALLLATPRSRTHLLLWKTAPVVILVAGSVLGIWGAIYLSAAALDVSIAGLDVGALMLHLFASSLFYGFLATAVGAWTGNRGAAVGAAVGLMIASFVAVGVLPVVEGAEDLVKAFPWYYFDGAKPLLNGVAWGHVGVLLAASAVFASAAVIGLNRRDLKAQSVGPGPLERLRSNAIIRKTIGRLGASAHVSSIRAKTASEYQTMLVVAALYTFLVQGIMIGPIYAGMSEEALASMASYPEAMVALFGGGDLATPEGYYQIETFGMMAPVVVMIVTIAIGAGALAGEESRRTMGLLLANPVRRSRVILEKSGTMAVFALFLGFVTFAGVALGSAASGLGMNTANIAATCALQTLVGLAFGALALALGAATGRKAVAIFVTIAAGVALHLFNGLTILNDSLSGWAWVTPFHYYLGNDPLNNGIDWSNVAVLAGMALALIALSLPLFQRRDLRLVG